MALSSGIWVGGKYRIERELGEGGMGFVYEASHVKLGAKVAIKLLREEILRVPGVRERFFREASISARIVHARVARVTDVDEDPQLGPYMVMDLLRGENLGDVLDRGTRIDVSTVAALLDQVLDGLSAAHAQGVVHRDLKPENVFLVGGLAALDVRVIDFGIAKVKDAAGQALTAAGTLMGTAEYMAPEQVRSAAQVDARADLYSVGVMAYEMLSQVRPFEGLDPVRASLRSERGEWKKLDALRPDLSADSVSWVHCAMAASPAERFASADAMRVALKHLLKAPSPVYPPPAATQEPQHAEVNPRARTVLDASGGEKTTAQPQAVTRSEAPPAMSPQAPRSPHVAASPRVAMPPPARSTPAPQPVMPPAHVPAAPRGAGPRAQGSSKAPLVLLMLGGAALAGGGAFYLMNASAPAVPYMAPAPRTPAPLSSETVQNAPVQNSPNAPAPATAALPDLGSTGPAQPLAPSAHPGGVRSQNPRSDGGSGAVDAGVLLFPPINTVVPPIQLPPMPKTLEELQKAIPTIPGLPSFPVFPGTQEPKSSEQSEDPPK